jgi:energy-coupling factor transport system permease protein
MVKIFNYIEKNSPVHKLTGAAKLLCMVLWVLAAMVTFDTRYLLALTIFALFLFWVSKIKVREVKAILIFSLVFLVLNNVLIYLFSPEHGVTLYGSRTLLVQLVGRYTITAQQLLYQANVVLKYTATIPVVILFISTTQPSEFAASLNKIGVSYSIAYSVSLALRYIPDLVDEFHAISLAQQARGIELSGKESLVRRLKGATSILMPLILSSMERIEVVSNAMELRCFGKEDKRTWYRERKMAAGDYGTIALGAVLLVITFVLQVVNGGRYWNPFV